MMRQERKSHSPGPHELENMQHNAVQDGASNPTSSATTANTIDFKQCHNMAIVI